MPTSDVSPRYARTLKQLAGVLGTTLLTGMGLLWLNQQAIERYWQQTWHTPSPWSDFSPAWWQAGARVETALTTGFQAAARWLPPLHDLAARDAVLDDDTSNSASTGLEASENAAEASARTADHSPAVSNSQEQAAADGRHLDSASVQTHTPAPAAETEPAVTPHAHSADAAASSTPPAPALDTQIPGARQPITLAPQDRALFIGDSMMQGVAPHIMKVLVKRYHVQSLNLSLQSTGLAYPNSYDWPGTLRSTLEQQHDIKVLVVFLGPNDPWDMPSRPRGPYLKFRSAGWESVYRTRIRDILDQAQAHRIAVIWIGPPAMKRDTLSEGVRYLNGLYQSEVDSAKQRYIAVDDLFGYQDHHFADPVVIDGRPVRLRSDDGTHFTAAGQKIIARAVLSQLQPAPTAPPDATPSATASP